MLNKLFNRGLLDEIRERLINIEAKQDGMAKENRIRLTNIENQPLKNIGIKKDEYIDSDPFKSFNGSNDQYFGHISYSQYGEDLLISNIFALLNIEKPSYLDVGANHPLKCSNTALMYSRGSRGTIVDANPNLMSVWAKLRPGDKALNFGVSTEQGELPFYCIDDFSGRNTFNRELAESFIKNNPQFSIQKVIKIPTIPINDIVSKYLDGHWPEFLSLDIEGLDYDVLESADFKHSQPLVICAELQKDSMLSTSPIKLINEKGYHPAFRTISNIISVRMDIAKKLNLIF